MREDEDGVIVKMGRKRWLFRQRGKKLIMYGGGKERSLQRKTVRVIALGKGRFVK